MRSQALKSLALVALTSGSLSVFAQASKATTPITKPSAISGEIEITLGNEDDNAQKYDGYKITNLNVADYLKYDGTIKRVYEGDKPSYNNYLISVSVSLKNAWRELDQPMMGQTMINGSGQFIMQDSTIETLHTPALQGSQIVASSFAGRIQGKRPRGWGDTISDFLKDAKNGKIEKMTRTVLGKTKTMDVKGKDPLIFQNLTLGAGPYRDLPQVNVNGDFTYAYTMGEEGLWNSERGITFSYLQKDAPVTDKMTGSMKYTTADGTATVNGKTIQYFGYYTANLMFNEDQALAASEDSVFAGEAQTEISEEDAFLGLATSGKVPSLTGKIYFTGSDTNFKAIFALDANNITPVQMTNFIKTYLLIVGPMNDD